MPKNKEGTDLAQLLEDMARMTAPTDEITAEILALGAAEPQAAGARERLQGRILARLNRRTTQAS